MPGDKYYWTGRLFSQYAYIYRRFKHFENLYLSDMLDYHAVKDDTAQPRKVHEMPGSFFRLKEMAHSTRKLEDMTTMESSLLWVIEMASSDVFHEMTRVRETLYKAYRNSVEIPKLRKYMEISETADDYGIESYLDLIMRTDDDSRSQTRSTLDSVKTLLDIPQDPFLTLFKSMRDHHTIKRTICKNARHMDAIYPKIGLDGVVRIIYDTDIEEFMSQCRESFKRKGFVEEASRLEEHLLGNQEHPI